MQGALTALATNTAPQRVLLLVSGALLALLGGFWVHDAQALVFFGCGVGLLLLIVVYRFDYLHPAVAYAVPWLTVLMFSTIPISTYARSLEFSTCLFLLAAIFTWLLATAGPPVYLQQDTQADLVQGAESREEPRAGFKNGVFLAFAILYAFAAFNVAFAGFVPLVSALTTGDSRYAEFGIPSVYGAFLAYANALGCLAFWAYLRTRSRVYLWLFLSVVSLHLVFMTRQNVVTLLVEAFVIRSLVSGRISRKKILVFVALGLTAFAALGDLRSGGIRDIIHVDESYAWIPTGLIWLYAYSYFNVLNLENTMTFSGAPFFDGTMWQNLLPSVLRPTAEHNMYLELEAMNVSSYIYPIYLDVGPVGVLLWTAAWGVVTAMVYRQALVHRRFAYMATYACLFFCALLSFFVAFWFYLPVIFQIAFFWLFDVFLFERPPAVVETASSEPDPKPGSGRIFDTPPEGYGSEGVVGSPNPRPGGCL